MDDNNKDSKQSNNNGMNLDENGWRAFGLVSAIGLDLAICTIGGTYLGVWLDKVLGTAPWMMLIGILVGLAAGILGIVHLLKAFGPESKR